MIENSCKQGCLQVARPGAGIKPRIVWSSPALRRARTTNLIEKVTRASSKATHGTIVFFFQTGHLTFKLPVRIGQAELKLEVPCAGRHGMDAAVCFFLGVFCSVARDCLCGKLFFFSPPLLAALGVPRATAFFYGRYHYTCLLHIRSQSPVWLHI
jgi:hypothetical protein